MSDALNRSQIAWRVAQDIAEGSFVNLGVGQPLEVMNFLPEAREIILHSENGILGFGPEAAPEDADPDLINAGMRLSTLLPGGAFFHHADSFAMVRGRHLDICVLGAFQVAGNGDLANWTTGAPGAMPAVGGAMDLAAGAKRVFVMMDHCTKDGAPKLVERCSFPLTGRKCVTSIFTDLAVIDITKDGCVVREMVAGLDFETLQSMTGAALTLAENCGVLAAPQVD